MALFGNRPPFLPGLQAAMAGQIPGVIVEDQMDPLMLAQLLGAPVPASGDFAPGAQPAPQEYYPEPPASNYGGQLPSQPLPPMPQPGYQPDSAPNSPLLPPPPSGGAFPAPPGASARPGGVYPPPPSFPPNPLWGDSPAPPKRRKNPVGKFLKNFAGIYGDNLTGNPIYAQHLQNKAKLKAEREEAERRARQPQQVGQSIIVPDGRGGYRTLYRDPSAAEAYALAQGFEPGTESYQEAVRQYRLGAWNDDAVEAKRGLTGYRYDRQEGLIDRRFDRSDRQLDRRLTVTRRGQDLGHQDRQASVEQSDTNNRRSTGTSRENNIRSNATRLQTSRGGRRPAAPVRVNSLEEARRLPPGTVFITPDGRVKVR
jgi:hypothetical protein